MSEETHYPAEREHWQSSPEGLRIFFRPIRPSDAPGLVDLHRRLSPESVYFRFFHGMRGLPLADAEHFATVDYRDRYAVVALLSDRAGEDIIGVGRYFRGADGITEFALVVEDRFQGHRIGIMLFEHLAAAAREAGITRMIAEVMLENTRARHLMDHLRVVHKELKAGVLTLEIDLSDPGSSGDDTGGGHGLPPA